MKYDYSLYLVTDRANICKDAENADGRSSKDTAENIAAKNVTGKSNEEKAVSFRALCTAVEQAILGGCTMVQLREKEISSKDFYNLAKEVKQQSETVIPKEDPDLMEYRYDAKEKGNNSYDGQPGKRKKRRQETEAEEKDTRKSPEGGWVNFDIKV